MIHHTRKLTCWLLLWICPFTWNAVPFNQVFAQKPAQVKDREQAAEQLVRLFDALEKAAQDIPRDTFDPQAIINRVGWDPVKLFEWVRDNTYLVPYCGSLRGHIGVLMDRLGNSLDRAILLHKLLTMTGYEARLVRGSLTREQAEDVLNNMRPVPPEGALPAEVQPIPETQIATSTRTEIPQTSVSHETEPNDNPEEAQDLIPGTRMEGNFQANDEDW